MREATHPVNVRRMRSLAAAMQRQAAAERDPNAADVLDNIGTYIGTPLAAIGEIVEDPEMQRYLWRCAASPASPGATTGRVPDKPPARPSGPARSRHA